MFYMFGKLCVYVYVFLLLRILSLSEYEIKSYYSTILVIRDKRNELFKKLDV